MQTNDGSRRAERSWPPADARAYTSPLRSGSYDDDGSGSATGTSDTGGVWTISPRLPYAAHLAGSGTVTVDVATTRPNANLVVDVYDLDETITVPPETMRESVSDSFRLPSRQRGQP